VNASPFRRRRSANWFNPHCLSVADDDDEQSLADEASIQVLDGSNETEQDAIGQTLDQDIEQKEDKEHIDDTEPSRPLETKHIATEIIVQDQGDMIQEIDHVVPSDMEEYTTDHHSISGDEDGSSDDEETIVKDQVSIMETQENKQPASVSTTLHGPSPTPPLSDSDDDSFN
jgi:hypothetical protein